jgi:hypothetical protein
LRTFRRTLRQNSPFAAPCGGSRPFGAAIAPGVVPHSVQSM